MKKGLEKSGPKKITMVVAHWIRPIYGPKLVGAPI